MVGIRILPQRSLREAPKENFGPVGPPYLATSSDDECNVQVIFFDVVPAHPCKVEWTQQDRLLYTTHGVIRKRIHKKSVELLGFAPYLPGVSWCAEGSQISLAVGNNKT